MKLNCKPGDLAQYVGLCTPLRGWVFYIVSPAPDWGCGPCWWVDPPPPKWIEPEFDSKLGVRDSGLRPLRDPGDDAKDETLLWLPVPGVKETA